MSHSATDKTRRIAIVGPITPFRSGVAKHTTEVAKELASRRNIDVTVFSFKRQYPALLFPGEADRETGQSVMSEWTTVFEIDSLNPGTWCKTAKTINQEHFDQVIIPAWTFFLAPCLGTIAKLCRKSGIKVTMIVHNVDDHEASFWKSWLSRFQLNNADCFVTHGSELENRIKTIRPNASVRISPHPIFSQYPAPKNALERRAPLELLFFGLIRDYKGLDIALKGIAESHRQDIQLSIVGEFWEGRKETESLIDRLGLRPRVEIVPRFVSDAEAAEFFGRCDAVLLPYKSVTGSGVIPVAYHYGKPVIVSDLPGLTDVVNEGKTGWVVPLNDPAAIGRLMDTEVTAEKASRMKENIDQACSNMTWSRFADHLLA